MAVKLTEREKADQNRYLASLAGSPEWAELVRRIAPDLFIVLSLFPASALVLRLLAKEKVAGSSPVFRSLSPLLLPITPVGATWPSG